MQLETQNQQLIAESKVSDARHSELSQQALEKDALIILAEQQAEDCTEAHRLCESELTEAWRVNGQLREQFEEQELVNIYLH